MKTPSISQQSQHCSVSYERWGAILYTSAAETSLYISAWQGGKLRQVAVLLHCFTTMSYVPVKRNRPNKISVKAFALQTQHTSVL